MKKVFLIINIIIVLNIYSQEQILTYINKGYNISPGEYYMLDYPVNIRAQPDINSNIIGKLNLHDKIEIIENTGNLQSIDNIFQYWYQIKFGIIEGYIWGGYISIKTLICDFDNNGINDYFYIRYSCVNDIHYNGYYDFDDKWHEETEVFYDERIITPNDIIIYINNKRIQISEIEKYYYDNNYGNTKYWTYWSP